MANKIKPLEPVYLDWVRDNLKPDFETGKLYWTKSGRGHNAGGEAGRAKATNWKNGKLSKAYYNLSLSPPNVKRRTVKVHTLMFWFYYGRLPEGYCDHISGDSLDNRPVNLREVNPVQNGQNKKKANRAGSSSEFKGVARTSSNKFRGLIKLPYSKVISLPVCAVELTAAESYDLASIVLHGDYGYRNFPDTNYSPEQISQMKAYIDSKRVTTH